MRYRLAGTLFVLAATGPVHAQQPETSSPAPLDSSEQNTPAPDADVGTAAMDEASSGTGVDPAEAPSSDAPSETDSEPALEAMDLGDLSEMSLEELLDVPVVTASGEEEKRVLASTTVRVVTREEIERRGYRSLAEVLANVPGLYVVDDHVMPSLAVRGVSGGLRAGTRIVRVMIDGVQVNFRPELTAFLGPEYIPLEAVERVEIALGPLSAVYGANAFLATVNVITRKPEPGVSAEVRLRGSRMGSYSSYGDSGMVAVRKGHSSVTAAFVLDHTDRSGLALQHTFAAQDPDDPIFTDRSENDLARGKGAYIALGTELEHMGSLSLVGGLQQLDAMGEFQVNSLFTHNNRLILNNYWTQATWRSPCSGSVCVSLSAGWAHGAAARNTDLRLTEAPMFTFVPNYGYRAFNGGAKVEWTPIEGLELTVGVDGEHDREDILYYTQILREPIGNIPAGDRTDVGMDADDPRDVILKQGGAFLQARAMPLPERLPGLHLTGSLRADAVQQGDVDFPLETNWRTAAAYEFSPNVAARINAGQAFQTPSAVLMFARPGFGTIGNVVGNETITPRPDPLTPQTVTSVEMATTVRLFEVVALELGVYTQKLKDPIEFVRHGANYRAVNRDEKRRSAGLEATLRYAQGRIATYASGSILRDIEEGKLVDDPPASFPNALWLLGADVKVPEAYLYASAQARWVAQRGATQPNIWVNNDNPYSLPAYGLVDVTLSTLGLGLMGDSTETRFALGVRNLFNAEYSEPGYGGYDVPSLGRILFAEARLIL